MARVDYSKPKGERVKNIFSIIAFGVLFAVLIAGIVLLIVWLVQKNKNSGDKEFDETYPTAKLITYEDLAGILDNDTRSEYMAGTVYVYLYSPDYETYPIGKVEGVQNAVNACIAAYKDYAPEGEYADYAFYVINTSTKENKTYITEHSSFLTDNNITTSDSTNFPRVIEITGSETGISVKNTYYTQGEIINKLTDICNLVKVEE